MDKFDIVCTTVKHSQGVEKPKTVMDFVEVDRSYEKR
jgi:hypothetical protein